MSDSCCSYFQYSLHLDTRYSLYMFISCKRCIQQHPTHPSPASCSNFTGIPSPAMLTAGQRRAVWGFFVSEAGPKRRRPFGMRFFQVDKPTRFISWGEVEIHPGKLTWNLKMNPWKRRFLLETIIFRFHVSFNGGVQWKKFRGSKGQEEHLIVAWYHWNCLHLWKVKKSYALPCKRH